MAVKVMYLMDYYAGSHGGTERQFLQLVQLLDRSRYEPAITLLRSTEYAERNGFPCPMEVIGINTLTSLRSIFKLIYFVLRLRQKDYQLVHCFFNDSSLIAPLFKLFGIRVIVSRRDMGFWYTPRNLLILRSAAPFIDRYVANSQAVKRIVEQQESVPANKISVIYNGYAHRAGAGSTPSSTVKLSEIPTHVPLIGIVANLSPVKRVDTLMEAFGQISSQYPDARLVIVGNSYDPRMRDPLVDLARCLGVHERVIFTGSVEDPSPYIKRFDVAVLCSESEGFSNSLMEYMQAGRPVVCTDTGGNPELVQDGHNGFLFPVGDATILADRLAQLLSDNALAHRLGKAARETVCSTYTYTRMVTEQMACYDEILTTGRTKRKLFRWLGRVWRC